MAHVVSSTAAAAEVVGGEQRTSSAELWLIDDMHNARGLIELVTLMGASPKSRQGAWWCNWPPASKCTARVLAMVDGVAFVMRVELSLEIFASPSHHKEVHCATHLGLLGQAPHVQPQHHWRVIAPPLGDVNHR